jgi:hypothetical protein
LSKNMAPNFFGCPFPHRLMVGEWLVVTRIPIGKHTEKRRRDWRRILPGRSSHIIAPGQGGFLLYGELGLFRRRYGRIGPRCCAQNALYVAMAVWLAIRLRVREDRLNRSSSPLHGDRDPPCRAGPFWDAVRRGRMVPWPGAVSQLCGRCASCADHSGSDFRARGPCGRVDQMKRRSSLHLSTALLAAAQTVPSRPFICAPVTQVTERSAGMGDDDRHCSLEHQADGDRR